MYEDAHVQIEAHVR